MPLSRTPGSACVHRHAAVFFKSSQPRAFRVRRCSAPMRPQAARFQRWDGEALGADASISLAGLEPHLARNSSCLPRRDRPAGRGFQPLQRNIGSLSPERARFPRRSARGIDGTSQHLPAIFSSPTADLIRPSSRFGGFTRKPMAILVPLARRRPPRSWRGSASSGSVRCRGTLGE